MPPYWTAADLEKVTGVKAYRDFLPIAQDVLRRIPQPRCIVCGPISTGGLGSVEKNLAVFDRAVARLTADGHSVWSQSPLEDQVQRIKHARREAYPDELLTGFFLPLFESGLIQEFHFLPGWESSHGARWENEQASRLGIKRLYFPADWETSA